MRTRLPIRSSTREFSLWVEIIALINNATEIDTNSHLSRTLVAELVHSRLFTHSIYSQ